jgi:transcription elongation factor Elf1
MQTCFSLEFDSAMNEESDVNTRRDSGEPPVEDARVTCPSCRQGVANPGIDQGGSMAMAECLACDIYFAACPK